MAGMILTVRMGKIPANRLPMLKEVAKIQALDIHIAKGGATIEDIDILLGYNEHGLEKSDELTAILARAEKTQNETMNVAMQ